MIAAIYLNLLGDPDYRFEIEILSKIKSVLHNLITFDLDARSDPSMLDYAIQLLKESDKAVVFIAAGADISPRIFTLLEEVSRNAPKYKLFLEGENRWIEKMFSEYPGYLNRDLSDEEKFKATEAFLKDAL